MKIETRTLASDRDPGVKMRRRVSFEATNLAGSSQDDVKVKGPTFRFAKNGAPGTDKNVCATKVKGAPTGVSVLLVLRFGGAGFAAEIVEGV